MSRRWLRPRARVVWAVVRLPATALLLYAARRPILDLIEARFDIFHVTRFVIDLLSTPVTRLVAGIGVLVILLSLVLALRHRRGGLAYAALLAAGSAFITISFYVAGTSPRRAALVTLILAVNLAPSYLLQGLKRSQRLWSAFMLAGIGVAELFLMRHYWLWLRERDEVQGSAAGAIPGLLLTSLAFAFFVSGDKLLQAEQMIRMSGDVRVIERGLSFNWIELDSSRKYLYATGHELPRLRRYDLRNLSAPPLLSDVSTGGSQGFAYDPRANEIYTLNVYTNELFYLDASTLARRRSVHVSKLSPGDPWVVVDPISDTLTIVSEADVTTGVSFLVLDRRTGDVIDRRDLDAGNVLVHPHQPWVYLSFFRRRSQLMLYDLQRKAVTRVAPSDPRSERIVFWAGANEVLVSSPLESRIVRFDAERLHPKGHIQAPFGARAIAIDDSRQLLLCGNLASGQLTVIDLQSGKWVRNYYLGPWLRTIQLNTEHGTAYVSANGALYSVDYARPLAAVR